MTPPDYRERLRTPWWAHPVVVVGAVVIALESSFLIPSAAGQLALVVVFALAGEAIVWSAGSRLVEVGGGYVRAGRFRLPIAQVRAVAVLDPDETRRELRSGDSDAAAVYRCTRSWVPTAVLLDVDDPGEAGLWLVSTRHPDRVAAALADAAQTAAVG